VSSEFDYIHFQFIKGLEDRKLLECVSSLLVVALAEKLFRSIQRPDVTFSRDRILLMRLLSSGTASPNSR
jgi:hypothetical protein